MAQLYYDYTEGLYRIDKILNSGYRKEFLPIIPMMSQKFDDAIDFVMGTVMTICIKSIAELLGDEERFSNTRVIQAFLTETYNVCVANSNFRDIYFSEDYVRLIYSTPKKVDVDSVIDDSARIRSLSQIITQKANTHGIQAQIDVRIGIHYGEIMALYLNPANENWGRKTMFVGPAVERSKQLANDQLYGCIAISNVVWNNLNNNNQRLFKHSDKPFSNDYEGDIVNVPMNNWLLNNKTSK